MSRRGLIALIVGPTLLLGLAIGALLVVEQRAVRADVETADRAAAAYTGDLQDFRDAFGAALEDEDDVEDPGTVAEVLDSPLAQVPQLPDVPERGMEGSSAYRAAQEARVAVTESLADLEEVVGEAREVGAFVVAAETALGVDPQALLPQAAYASGAPVRAQLLPPVRQALATFRDAEVPERGEEAAAAVETALQAVIEGGETLAAELDAGRGYRFEYGEPYSAAQNAVRGLAASAGADLREAVDRVAGRGVGA